MIREAEQEYNKLRQFGTKYDYPMGNCDNIVDLFQKLRQMVNHLKQFNDEKITGQELGETLVGSFKDDLESSYKRRKRQREIRRILKPIILTNNPKQTSDPK